MHNTSYAKYSVALTRQPRGIDLNVNKHYLVVDVQINALALDTAR